MDTKWFFLRHFRDDQVFSGRRMLGLRHQFQQLAGLRLLPYHGYEGALGVPEPFTASLFSELRRECSDKFPKQDLFHK